MGNQLSEYINCCDDGGNDKSKKQVHFDRQRQGSHGKEIKKKPNQAVNKEKIMNDIQDSYRNESESIEFKPKERSMRPKKSHTIQHFEHGSGEV